MTDYKLLAQQIKALAEEDSAYIPVKIFRNLNIFRLRPPASSHK